MADHWKVNRDDMIGSPIEKYYPHSKMPESLRVNQDRRLVWYQGEEAYGDVEASLHSIIRKGGEALGVMSYDLFQDIYELEDLINIYVNINDEIKYYKKELRNFQSVKYSINNIVGISDPIIKLKEDIRRAAKTNSTVVITGESGTGKELVAHSIHNLSKRSLNNFIKVNASTIPETLAESELFGYTGGSFTGANKTGKKGKFEMADKGTLFIDEIGWLPASIQPKLLRVLQEHEIDSIGSEKSKPVDVRIISATNIPLKELAAQGKFRWDLYYRLNVVEIRTPSLRERKEDIPFLVDDILKGFHETMGTSIISVDPLVLKMMNEYEWPGNVRELQNVLERAINYADGNTIGVNEFRYALTMTNEAPYEFGDVINTPNPIEEAKKKAEIQLIIQTLKEFNGNKSKAAEFLKISRSLLYQKIRRLKIK